MKRRNQIAAIGVILALGLCGLARAQQVLQQAPSDAVAVFEVKNLQDASAKVAKMAKSLGIDQFYPQWADPLAALMDEMGLKQGLNKNGDLALVFFQPPEGAAGDGAAAKDEPRLIALIPTDDFKAFLGNFQDVKDAGDGMSELTVPKNNEKLFAIERGKYAAVAKDKSLLSKQAGMKLPDVAAKEAQAKDAILYFDLKALRPMIQKGLKDVRAQMANAAKNPGGANAAAGPNPFPPGMEKLMGHYLDAVDNFVRSANSSTISFNLTDTGIGTAAVTEFDPQSDLGQAISKMQNTDAPLLAGLPKATYFAFGGMKMTPEAMTKIFSDFIDPLKKDLAMQGDAAKIDEAFDAMKQAMANVKQMTVGYAEVTAPNQGVFEVIGVGKGDAKKILEAQKKALPAAASFAGIGNSNMSADVTMGDAETVDGVSVQRYTMKFNFKGNDMQSRQAQQMLSMMYGRDGMKGALAAVNDDTFLSVQGGGNDLLSDAIAAAKNNTDELSQAAHVKAVSAELPKQRGFEFYIALDNIANAAVKFAKQNGFPVQFKLPPNLPPIGVTGGTEGSNARVDAFIPTQLIQSMTAAVMQTMMQMNGGPGGAGQGGGI